MYRLISKFMFSSKQKIRPHFWCLILCLYYPLSLHAQAIATPYWITKPPLSKSDDYYYRVTSAEGKTYNDAYVKAFSMAILESQWKLGVKVQKVNNIDTIEQDITKSINVESVNMKLPLNKVCEYVEPLYTSNGIRIYILWQVARYGNVDPKFDDFNDCD